MKNNESKFKFCSFCYQNQYNNIVSEMTEKLEFEGKILSECIKKIRKSQIQQKSGGMFQNGDDQEESSRIGDFSSLKWSMEENLAFIMFMDYYKIIFSSKKRRRGTKIYLRFSEFLKSRTPRQCRSRYQKIMKVYRNFSSAKKHFLKKYPLEDYEMKFKTFSSALESHPGFLKFENQRIQGISEKTPKKEKQTVQKMEAIPEINNNGEPECPWAWNYPSIISHPLMIMPLILMPEGMDRPILLIPFNGEQHESNS